MADAHVHGLHTGSRPQNRTDPFSTLHQSGSTASFHTGLTVDPHESALSAADGRPTADDPDVTREPEAPGMGNPLCITHDGVWLGLELLQRSQHGRRLTEREQAGYVWERQGYRSQRLLQDRFPIPIPHDGRSDTAPSVC